MTAICPEQSEVLPTAWMKVESVHVMTVQATWETNAMSVLMVGILQPQTILVQVRPFLANMKVTFRHFVSGCGCNMLGISGTTSACDGEGICTCTCDCDASQGYSGGLSGKCDDCLDNWYWTTADNTCTSEL